MSKDMQKKLQEKRTGSDPQDKRIRIRPSGKWDPEFNLKKTESDPTLQDYLLGHKIFAFSISRIFSL